jgi:hypothetical protein
VQGSSFNLLRTLYGQGKGSYRILNILLIQVTLRYFASGDSYKSLEDVFRIPVCTIAKIVAETSRALWTVLQPEYVLQHPPSGWKLRVDSGISGNILFL